MRRDSAENAKGCRKRKAGWHSVKISNEAYVMMPEHVHMLTSEPEVRTVATVLKVLKVARSSVIMTYATGKVRFIESIHLDKDADVKVRFA